MGGVGVRWVWLLLGLVLSCGAWAEKIEPSGEFNPPPASAFSAFKQFEMKPIELPELYAKNKGNRKAVAKLQEHLDRDVGALISGWSAGASPGARKLLIEPRIDKIKFIGGGKRFWAGAFAGKSAILMRVRFSDADTGEEIADPEFYQHAAAMSGAWSMGGADNAMLARESTLIASYLSANYDQAVGGPTKLPDEKE
ncbi:MAG: hypothetical protein KDI71_19695 [Xanthomonadales bacterium]|nr:hypothetical protein [Xanthomonadales bacterium]